MTRPSQPAVLGFGPFALYRAERLLLCAGQPVLLPRGGAELLLELVDHAGRPVDERTLASLARLPQKAGSVGLWKHVAALNKALQTGSDRHYVAHHPDQGYCFMGGGVFERLAMDPDSGAASRLPSHVELVGRDATLAALSAQLMAHRLVTLVGPGGVGKTVVAVAVAERLASEFEDRACFIDLSALARPEALANVIAAGLGVDIDLDGRVEDTMPMIQQYLGKRSMLIVLDNCEHLATAAAMMAEKLLSAPGVCVLTTSREPLRARGEVLHSLPGMDVPPVGALSPDQAMAYSAVRLFVQRANSDLLPFALDPDRVDTVVEICRYLDGVPMALELAAARVATMGLPELLSGLRNSPLNIQNTADVASQRHRTLQATLDWSHALLGEAEQLVFRRLAVFRGSFPLESALRVTAAAELGPEDALDALLALTDKSLLNVEVTHGVIRYRLLQTTRAYAGNKLEQTSEVGEVKRRHAQECRDRLARIEAEWQALPKFQWIARHGSLVDDVRSGIDWALSTLRDDALGSHLLIAALPLVSRLSLHREFVGRLRLALARSDASPVPDRLLTLQLNAALCSQLMNLVDSHNEMMDLGAKVLGLAAELGQDSYAAPAWVGLWMASIKDGAYAQATRAAERHVAWATKDGDAVDLIDAQRNLAYATHFHGEFARAKTIAQQVIATPLVNPRVHYYNAAQIDHQVAMRIVLSRILWIQGFPSEALSTVATAIELGRQDRPSALCQVLAFAACPIAIWCGDHAAASTWALDLMRRSAELSMTPYESWAVQYLRVLPSARDTEITAGAPAPTTAQCDTLGTLDCRWLTSHTIQRVAHGEARWCAAEILRAQGEMALQDGGSTAKAERFFQNSLDIAREQGALAWELRSASSLARLKHAQGLSPDGLRVLEPVFQRFTEGHETADLRAAARLVRSLSEHPAQHGTAT